MNNAAMQFHTIACHFSHFYNHDFADAERYIFLLYSPFTRSGSLNDNAGDGRVRRFRTLNATTCVLFALSTFTISSIAPTLFGKKTENA